MKRFKKQLIAVLMMLTIIVADLAAPIGVQAATKSIIVPTAHTLAVQKWGHCFGLHNTVKSDKIYNVKSSNKKVVSVKVEYENYGKEYNIIYQAKKAGTATVSFTVKRKNGKRYNYRQKITVFKYANPFKQFKYAGKDYSKEFNKLDYNTRAKTDKKGKISVSLKKGYKLVGIYLLDAATGKKTKVKNGSNIRVKNHYLYVEYKTNKYTNSVFLVGKNVQNWG